MQTTTEAPNKQRDDGDAYISSHAHSAATTSLAAPRPSQPIATHTHAPVGVRALAARARARCPRAQLDSQLNGGHSDGGALDSDVDSSAALVVVVPPLHRWATQPDLFVRLMQSLLRGHLQHWTVLLYSSRAKALQHCSNLARAPLDSQSPWLPPALLDPRRRPLVVHALCTTSQPLHTLETLARPLHLPLIYLGADPTDLAECYAHINVLPHVVTRPDQLFDVATCIRAKNDEFGGGGGAGRGREGASSRNYPYPAMLRDANRQRMQDAYAAEALQHWVMYGVEGEPPPPFVSQLDGRDSQPDLPRQVVTHERKPLTHGLPPGQRTVAQRREECKDGPLDSGPLAVRADVAPSHHSAAASVAARAGVASPPAMAPTTTWHLLPPPTQLHVDVPSSPATAATRISIVDERGRTASADVGSPGSTHAWASRRPTPRSTAAAVRGPEAGASYRRVHFHHDSSAGASPVTSSRPASAASLSSSSLMSPTRTVRNPYGTADGLPSPQQKAEQHKLAHAQSKAGDSVGAPLQLHSSVSSDPARPLRLSVESKEDTEKLASIQALADRLRSYALPGGAGGAAPSPSLMTLPGDTWDERDAADAAYLSRSLAVLDPATRATLAAQRSSHRRSLPSRDLYGAERSKRGVIELKAAQQLEWERNHALNLHALQETRDQQVLLDRETVVERFVGARAYARELVERDRAAIERDKKRAVAERIRAFNEAQSTARERALARVPDAPALTNLQAVFLSPRPRRSATITAHAAAAADAQTQQQQLSHGATGPTSPSAMSLRPPLTPSRLASQHRPTPSEIEAALRKDYALLDSQRRHAEARTLQLESVVWAQRQKQKELEWQAKKKQRQQQQRRREDGSIEEEDEQRDPQAERVQLRSMLHDVFGDREEEERQEEEKRHANQDRRNDCDASATSRSDHASAAADRGDSTVSPSQRKRMDLFDTIVPELASVQRDRVTAWRARTQEQQQTLADQEAQRRYDDEQAELEREQREERRAAWREAHPPLPAHVMPKNMRRVERRNPHEWLEQHAIMMGEPDLDAQHS